VFGGKVPSHEKVLKEQMNNLKWEYKTIHLQYDPKTMKEAGYFKRMRGVGNAGATELLFIAWKVMRALICVVVLMELRQIGSPGNPRFSFRLGGSSSR